MTFIHVLLPCRTLNADDYDNFEAYERAREELESAAADDDPTNGDPASGGHAARSGAMGGGRPALGLKKALAEVTAQLRRDWNQHVTLSQVSYQG